MRILIAFLLINLFFVSCSEEKVPEEFLESKAKNEEKIKWILKDENFSLVNLDENARNFLEEFYAKRNFKSCWINDSSLSENGTILSQLLAKKLSFSIPQNRISYTLSKEKNKIIKEVYLTASLATLEKDLSVSVFDTAMKKCKPISFPDIADFSAKLNFKSKESKGIAYEIIGWGSKDTVYQKLAKKLFDFSYQHDFKDEKLKVPLQKKDSIHAVNLAKKALIQKKYLAPNSLDSIYLVSLKLFQSDNGITADGFIGQSTADALNETDLEKCQRTAFVLEKLRWKTKRGKRYIEVNIPEFKLRFFADDTLKSVNNVVVGKFDTQTPEFEASLRTIVAYPYWTVPYSITSKEILPDAKRNPNYFARNKMKIYKKEEELDPLEVNWKGIKEKTFPYKVVQQPGTHNSLGIIKFEFSNKYGVYVHDTPSKSLFKTVVRSYSHGCIRCEHPIDLAKIILEKDKNRVISDSLDSIMVRGNHLPIQLKTRIPIYIEYYSVVVNEKNQLIFLRDIYGRDKKMQKLMFQS